MARILAPETQKPVTYFDRPLLRPLEPDEVVSLGGKEFGSVFRGARVRRQLKHRTVQG